MAFMTLGELPLPENTIKISFLLARTVSCFENIFSYPVSFAKQEVMAMLAVIECTFKPSPFLGDIPYRKSLAK